MDKLFEGIQSPYLCFLKISQKLVSPLPLSFRGRLASLVLIILSVYYLLEYSKLLRFVFSSANSRGIFVLAMIVLLTVFSLKKEPLSKVRFSKPVMGTYFLFAISILIAGCLHPLREGWIVFAITLLVMPAFYIVWGNRGDYDVLFSKIASVWMKTGLLFYLISFICIPYDSWHFVLGRYAGITASPNYIGMISVSTIAAALYMLMKEKSTLLSILTVGASIMMVWIASSRTAMIADIAIIAIGIILIYKKSNPLMLRDPVRVMLALMIALLTGIAFIRVADIPAVNLGYQGIPAVRELTDTDEKYTDAEIIEYGIEVPATVTDNASSWTPPLVQIAYAEDTSGGLTDHGSGSDLSNGRLDIYRQVLTKINFAGHDPQQEPLYFNNPAIGLQEVKGAHNTPLDFTYVCGIISGLLCLALEVMAAVFVLRYVFSGKRPHGNALAVMLMTGYGIESMLDIQVIMGNRALVLLFFLAISIVSVKMTSDTNEHADNE